MSCLLSASLGIFYLFWTDPMTVHQGMDFVYCYLASLVWSLLLGEVLGGLIKAYIVWMASGKPPKDCGMRPFKGLLTYFPCVRPIQVLPTEF